MSALFPAALLLLWSGLAATALASLVLAPLLGESAAALDAAVSHPRIAPALLLGSLVLPLLYLPGFLLVGEANLLTGGLLGMLHAAVLGARSLQHGGRSLLRQNRRRLALRLAYGALLGFAYVMP